MVKLMPAFNFMLSHIVILGQSLFFLNKNFGSQVPIDRYIGLGKISATEEWQAVEKLILRLCWKGYRGVHWEFTGHQEILIVRAVKKFAADKKSELQWHWKKEKEAMRLEPYT